VKQKLLPNYAALIVSKILSNRPADLAKCNLELSEAKFEHSIRFSHYVAIS